LGEKNLSITTHDQHNITAEVVEQFRQLHIGVAGRETRSAATWRLQYQQILTGIVPLAGCVEDFHLQVSAPCWTQQEKGSTWALP